MSSRLFLLINQWINAGSPYEWKRKDASVKREEARSVLDNLLLFRGCCASMVKFNQKHLQELFMITKKIFKNLDNIKQFAVKVSVFHNVEKNKNRFELFDYLVASPNKHFNYVIKILTLRASVKAVLWWRQQKRKTILHSKITSGSEIQL